MRCFSCTLNQNEPYLNFHSSLPKTLFVKTFLKFVLSIIPFPPFLEWLLSDNESRNSQIGEKFLQECPSKFDENMKHCREPIEFRPINFAQEKSCNLYLNEDGEKIKGILWIKFKLALLKFSFNNDIDIPSSNANIFVWAKGSEKQIWNEKEKWRGKGIKGIGDTFSCAHLKKVPGKISLFASGKMRWKM